MNLEQLKALATKDDNEITGEDMMLAYDLLPVLLAVCEAAEAWDKQPISTSKRGDVKEALAALNSKLGETV